MSTRRADAERLPIAERLIDQTAPPGSALEVAAIHLRSAAARRPPAEIALARVGARLEVSTATVPIAARWRWKTMVTVVALSAGIGGVTGAAMWVAIPIFKRARLVVPSVPPPADPPARIRRPRARPQPGESPAAEVAGPPATGAEPEELDDPVPASVEQPLAPRKVALADPSRLRGPRPAPVSPIRIVPPAAATITEEARLLGSALQRLRNDHDPLAALAILDEHANRFPDSALAPEADLTRVDAMLALDQRPQALAILDRLGISTTTRGRELAVVRGELRVGAKRYAEAISDFSRTLDGAVGDSLDERALHGRIACYLETRNLARARDDLNDYLRRFPDGRFASDVRRTLRGIEPRE
jgi:hypothetical protein